MEFTGHGALSQRPRIGLTALAVLALLLAAVFGPTAAHAQDEAQGRVIGGTAATAADVSATGRWSAVVAVFATDSEGTRLCTGTLIAPNWVATAAHCLAQTGNATAAIPASDVYVAANTTAVATAGDNLINAVSTSVHPGFSWTNASWDVALIELANTVPTTPFALPDPLRAASYSAGSTENVAGYGRSQSTNSASSGTLRSGRLEQVNPTACETYSPGSGDYADCYVPGSTRQATCFGDSGGPLVRYDTTQGNAPALWGITSTGPDPCDAGTGGAFAPAFETRVTSVLDWLSAVMSGSSYVPTTKATTRSAATTGNTTKSVSAGNKTIKAPAGGTGIGVFQTKVNRAPSKKRVGKVTLSASFVGATGTGLVEIERCKKNKCKTVATTSLNFAAAATAVRATVAIPRCATGAVLNLKLSVTDSAGTLRDSASQRLARCS